MVQKKHLLIILIFLSSSFVYSQDFNEDGSMKLNEVSSSKKYGYSEKTAIKVGTISNEYAYIKSLQGPNGEGLQIRRIGSCCPFKSESAAFGGGLLDKWKITYEGLKKPIIIYINGYEYDAPKCPKGLGIKASNEVEESQSDD